MQKHVTILGWIYISHSALLMLAAGFVFTFVTGAGLFEGLVGGDPESAIIAPVVAGAVAAVLGLLAVPTFVAGMGLLDGRPWARILAFILGVIKLIDVPIGTAIGVYTLWVLSKPETDSIFEDNAEPGPSRSAYGL